MSTPLAPLTSIGRVNHTDPFSTHPQGVLSWIFLLSAWPVGHGPGWRTEPEQPGWRRRDHQDRRCRSDDRRQRGVWRAILERRQPGGRRQSTPPAASMANRSSWSGAMTPANPNRRSRSPTGCWIRIRRRRSLAILFILHHPSFRGLRRRRRPGHHPGLHQSQSHRARSADRVSHVRTRRPARSMAADFIVNKLKAKKSPWCMIRTPTARVLRTPCAPASRSLATTERSAV